ncbi:MAG TPA: TonB-dependent receptor, partial [Mucilaginibacter sp.]|nr:TonB-dependent receptor [Mucilaginibacter sp.]
NFTSTPPFPYPTRVTLLNVLATNLSLGKLRLQGSILNTNTIESVKTGNAPPNRNIYSPTIMATFQPLDKSNFQLRAFYKYIFRNPTFNDLYYDPVINPNLKPEFAREYDLGATYSKAFDGFLNYITLTADAYYNNVTNKIVFIPHDPYTSSVQNAGKADIKGLDAGLKTEANLSNSWKARVAVNYTYQQVINTTDPTSSIYLNQLPYTPKNTLAVNIGADNKRFGVYYNQVFLSKRYYTNDNLPYDTLPAYSVSDASAVYHFTISKSPITASFEVNNLFDKSYYIIQSYPMPGRSFRISLQVII